MKIKEQCPFCNGSALFLDTSSVWFGFNVLTNTMTVECANCLKDFEALFSFKYFVDLDGNKIKNKPLKRKNKNIPAKRLKEKI
ncbi:MAG: hypothetical protein ACR2MD_01875 [Aridibacter sp.]